MTDEQTLQKLITEYDDENPSETRSLAKYLEDRLGEVRSIKSSVAAIKKRMLQERNKHEATMQSLNKDLAAIRNECPHISTTYHPDASGNNDSITECNHCGKQAKRLK